MRDSVAVLYMDSMDIYSSGATAQAELQATGWILSYNTYITGNLTGGRYGTGTIKIQGVSGAYASLNRPVNIAASTVMFQMAFCFPSLLFANNRIWFIFLNNSGVDQVAALRAQLDGSIKAYNAADVLVATSVPGVITPTLWQYLEIKVVSNNGAGSILVNVDGTEVINISSIDTSISETDIDLIQIYPGMAGGGVNSTLWIDDVMILDDSGLSPHNDLVGDRRISPLLPVSDTATADWAKSGGSVGYALIDDAVPGGHDADATYIYDNTVGGKSLFEFENLTDPNSDVCAISVTFAVRKTDAGTKAVRVCLSSGGIVYNGSALPIGTDYQTHHSIWVRNPNGGALWSKGAVDALKAGPEVV